MLASSPVGAGLTRERVTSALAARGRHWRTRTILERDLWSYRRRYGAILGPAPTASRGVALLASLTHSPFQLKLEGMFAKAFQLKGLEVVAAVPAESEVARRYLEVYGVRRFVTLEEFLTPELEAEAQREAERLAGGIATAADAKATTFRGAGVGRQALSTLSRHLHEGAVDLGDAEARALLAAFLTVAARTTLASEALLDALRPELVLFNERNYAAEGPLSDLALERDLNVIQFVSGFEDDAMVFKRYTAGTKGLHPRSLSDESWPLVEALDWTPDRDRELDAEFAHRYDGTTFLARWNQGWTRKASREEVAAHLGLDTARRTAVVFSHVLWDANMFYGRDLFADQAEWFVETVRAACENDRVNWVVKLHPANVWKLRRDRYEGELDELVEIRKRIGELPPHVRLLLPDSELSTWSLFAVTDWGVTIRGSVGFELPCRAVPVLTAGTGFYSGRGFTVDSATADEYLGRLRAIEDTPPLEPEQVELARKHAYALFRLRQTRFTSFRCVYEPVTRVAQPFEATVELAVHSARELAEAEDLRRLGDWAVDSRAPDYLALPETAAP
jgi:hypothetical protein